ncbi:hypothetical protein HDU98_008791, partial [Podochytrium sp. JEL0797]
MAPERLQGAKLSPYIDIYAFAMTVYEIITDGDVPFTDTPDALIYQHVVHENIRPEAPEAEKYPTTSAKLIALMQNCWSADPQSRPAFSMISASLKSLSTTPSLSNDSDRLTPKAVTSQVA